MAKISDFTADNSGSPDQYTVNTVCRKITIREKDPTAASLADFRVYVPFDGSSYIQKAPGSEHVMSPLVNFMPGDKPFSMETVGVASAVFSVIEE